MIRCQELVPDYYIEESRDFQALCRIYDLTFNSLKFNIDTMQSLTNTKLVKDSVLPLVGDKFGIYDKASYSNRELLEALPIAVKHKGSIHSVKILLNAYLDSMEIFDYAMAYHSKDEKSAEEISSILHRDISPYTIVIVLSTTPTMTNLNVLNEYLKMVVPCGMHIEYIFGVPEIIFEKFRYNDYVFVFYTTGTEQSEIADKFTKYSAQLTTAGYENIKFTENATTDIPVMSVGLANVYGGKK